MTVKVFENRKGFLFFTLLILAGPLVIKSNYIISVMILIAIYGVLSIGMEILMGQAGLFSLAHPTWFGLGAYISGILTVRNMFPPIVSILVAGIIVAIVAYIIGAPILRLKGFYLACATFAIIIIAQVAASQLTDLTGGPEGLVGVPALSVAGFKFKTDLQFYYLSWIFCLACYLFCSNLISSRMGRAIKSFHDSEVASGSVGINVPSYKLQVFVLTSAMASIVGGIFCFYLRFVVPESFGFLLLLELLMMTILGGLEDIRGALIGTISVLWLKEFLNNYLRKVFPSMSSGFDTIFFGILIIVVLIFMPRGLVGWMDRLRNLWEKQFHRTSGEI